MAKATAFDFSLFKNGYVFYGEAEHYVSAPIMCNGDHFAIVRIFEQNFSENFARNYYA